MHRLAPRLALALAFAAAPAAFYASSAGAAGPQHIRFSQHFVFDDDTCSFPIVAEGDFTNDITEFDAPDGSIERLELHQSFVATWTGNGVTLDENDHEQTFVTFADGSATQAKHVGVTLRLQSPDGRLFQVAGQEVFTVVNGFDRDLIAAHGIDIDFDPATYCAAFGG